MSHWWIADADRHLAAIMNRDTGPFCKCSEGHYGEVRPLPLVPAPHDWWTNHGTGSGGAADDEPGKEHDPVPAASAGPPEPSRTGG